MKPYKRMQSSCCALTGLVLFLVVVSVSAAGVVVHDVDYKAELVDGNDKDLLDIYMPEGADGVPVIVYFHGGALRIGSKEDGKVVASRLLQAGIGVVSASYRLSPSVRHPAHVRDAAAATAWVVKNIHRYGGNPYKVYLSGHSAGAYLATLLALDPGHLRAYGLDAKAIRGTIPISPFLYVEETAAVRPKDVWGVDPVDWMAASVTPHIASGKAPMLLIYADGDEDWRKRQNQSFATAMRAQGNDIRVVEVPGRDHMRLISEINNDDDKIAALLLEFMQKQ